MEQKRKQDILDLDFRHYIYTTFAETSFPPTTLDVADHFKINIAAVEGAFERLAEAHYIALAPGSHTIWMAHPFSGIPTNYNAEVENKKKYSGN